MSPHLLGIGFVLTFVISTAFRDIYFSGVFQNYSFFAIVLLAFPLCTICFTLVTTVKAPRQFLILLRHWRDTLWLNITSAAAWLSYFYALKTLEPSVVNTIHVGVGPITIIALSGFGIHIAQAVSVRQLEKLCYLGIVIILALLGVSVLAGWSASAQATVASNSLSLLLALASGVFI